MRVAKPPLAEGFLYAQKNNILTMENSEIKPKWNKLAIISVIPTALSFLIAPISAISPGLDFFVLFLWALSLPLAIIALRQIKTKGEKGKFLAYITIVLGIIIFILIMVSFLPYLSLL